MLNDGPGVLDFQLYLLKTMDPPDQLLAAALERLGSTRAEMKDRYEAVSPMMALMSGSSANLRSLLAAAVVDKTLEAGGEKLIYSFGLWPRFNFGIRFVDQGEFVSRAAFERKPQGPAFARPIHVWNFLTNDLSNHFGNVKEIDAWGHYETFLADDLDDGRKYFLRFGWGLLQEMESLNSGLNSAMRRDRVHDS